MIGTQKMFNGQLCGYELVTDYCHYFFSTAACAKDDLAKIFPQYEFRFLAQIHGNDLVESQAEKATADAHWTKSPGLALVVQSADCLPVLFGTEDLVIAAHAGWRGVENELLLQCAKFLQERKDSLDCVLIGPHIQAPDFEVSLDVADQLVAAYRKILPDGPLPTLPHPDAGKRRINLAQIASCQIRSVLGHMIPLEISRESTFASPLFHSYRRGKAGDARQYSFVAKL